MIARPRQIGLAYHKCQAKGETGKGLDCAHPLVLNNMTPISWASFIMSLYDENVWGGVRDKNKICCRGGGGGK